MTNLSLTPSSALASTLSRSAFVAGPIDYAGGKRSVKPRAMFRAATLHRSLCSVGLYDRCLSPWITP